MKLTSQQVRISKHNADLHKTVRRVGTGNESITFWFDVVHSRAIVYWNTNSRKEEQYTSLEDAENIMNSLT